MAIGDVFLSAFMTVLFEKLVSGELLKFFRHAGIDAQMKKLTDLLSKIQTVLLDAEEKQLTDRFVQQWLDDLQELAYDLDDVLDEFTTEALRRKLMGETTHASTSKVWNFIPTCCTNLNPSAVIFDFNMGPKIKEMTDRLLRISEQISQLNLVNVVGTKPGKAWKSPETTSLVLEPRIYGREQEKRRIIELLVNQNSNKLGVIPIVGMGGIGKTTLAQMVYNDETVKNHFDLKAWVCVSEEFDIMRITKVVLELVTSQSFKSFKSLEQVQVQLKQALARKKFLIVLDDVWNKKYSDWNVLKAPFNDGAQGSKVIVTTRNRDVAKMIGAVELHDIEALSDDDCWSLFMHHAFENTSIDANPNLESIGRKIVEKCKGLPLAARTLGGLLKCKERIEEWEDVLHSKIWDLSDEDSDILPALRLSYHNLPAHLKRCFAYCAIMPKDYEFEEEEIVLLWVAEGLIQQQNRERQMEDIGSEYFRELFSRFFFQPSNISKSSTFVMHDLINDLAQSVARGTCFRLEDKLKDQMQCKNLEKARHSSYIQGYFDGMKEFETLYEANNLRTFLPFCFHKGQHYWTKDVPINLFLKMRFSRVLSLSRYFISKLPDSIGDLKHLRFLNFSYTKIESLPESFGTLYNLQTLLLRECTILKKLPTDMGNLINLRHLDTTNANSLKEMPVGIPKLTCLQTLSNFIIMKNNGIRIRELGKLIHLKGMICISGLENVSDPLDARAACLHEKLWLDVLSMEWSENSNDPRNERVETEVLNMVRPHEKLRQLRIRGYLGIRFPSWIGDPLYSKMTCIRLRSCKNCSSLPPLGQLPSLKELYIEGMSAVKHVRSEFYGQGCTKPFPLLESFENMLEWEDWHTFRNDKEAQPFARVQNLSILKCPKLTGMLPSDLPCLKNLRIQECPQLLSSLPKLLEMSNTSEPNSLSSLYLKDVSIPGSLCNPSEGAELMLANAISKHLSSLTSLVVDDIRKLTFLPKCIIQELRGLEKLYISNCNELVMLWQNEVALQHLLPRLQRLKISDCPHLGCFFEEEKEFQQQHCLDTLQYLRISKCEKLEKLPRELHSFTSLRDLEIYNCASLVAFPKAGLPSTLRKLDVSLCRVLQSLFGSIVQNNLEILTVFSCPSLTYLISCRGGGLPLTLKHLQIRYCEKLEALMVEEGMNINCPFLEFLSINHCQSLKRLPDALPNNNNLSNLRDLSLKGCEKLESVPVGWLTNLNSLQQLSIDYLNAGGGIFSYFVEKGNNFLTNLTSLEIGVKKKMTSEWVLHRFSSLIKLAFNGPIYDVPEENPSSWCSFSVDGMLLPNSLTRLWIMGFPNMEKLSFKDFQKLTSLNWLRIHRCPRLASFPEQGLPPSLEWLSISETPILAHRCEKQKGEYWPLISRIPKVEIW